MIYLDNAATTLRKPQAVLDAVLDALQHSGNCARGVHEASLSAAHTVYTARRKLADFFGCSHPEQVIFTANITEALNLTLRGLFSPGDHIISTDLEHNSVLRPLYLLRDSGVAVDFVPADAHGSLCYDTIAPLISSNTKAIVCTHASNVTGNLIDLDIVGAIAAAHGLLLIVDAAQTAGEFSIDLRKTPIDVLCFTGHKGLLGPQGTGGLCLREPLPIRPWKVGGTGVQSYLEAQPDALPTRLEAGTLNTPGIAGLSAAIDFLMERGIPAIHEREAMLTRRFYEGIRTLPGIRIYGDFSGPRAPIVSLNLGDTDAAALADALAQDYGIAVRAGAHCAPRMHRALGTVTQGTVRFSFSCFNTEAEIDAAIHALRELSADCPEP